MRIQDAKLNSDGRFLKRLTCVKLRNFNKLFLSELQFNFNCKKNVNKLVKTQLKECKR